MAPIRSFRPSLALALAFLLAACGGGADYQKPIQTFAEATATAQDSLREYVIAVDRQAEAALLEVAAANWKGVEVPEGDCAANDRTKCRILFRKSKDDKKVSLSPEFSAPKTLALFDVIKTYADGLQAIATSDSATKAAASLASANGSLKALAELIEKKGKAPAYAEPVTSAAAWLAGKYIDNARLGALRTATQQADPLIGEAATYFSETMAVAVEGIRKPFADAVTDRKNDFSDNPTQNTLKALIAAVGDYNAALSTEPTKVFDKFRSAHHELTEALKSKELSLASAFAAMEALNVEAEKLKMIVDAFIAAGSKG